MSLLLLVGLVIAGCSRSDGKAGPGTRSQRDTSLRNVAMEYDRNGDLAQARAAIGKLGLANPSQLLLLLAEQGVSEQRPAEEIVPMARLAEAMGVHSARLVAYLEPTRTSSPVPPSPAPVQPTPTLAPTATPVPNTPAALPATETPAPTPVPQQPRVVADQNVNLRGGPGVGYPLVGQLPAGRETNIVGRTAGSDWWRVAWEGQEQAWVAGTVIKVLGPIDSVAVAQDVPTPPPQPTAAPAAPQPTAPPTAPPKPSVEYALKSMRLRPVGVDGQACNGGNHNIFAVVLDKDGNPLNGVRVHEVFTGNTVVTGEQGKGPGRAEWDIYRGGGGQLDVVNDAGNRISDVTRGMSADWPDADLMWDAGYCNCKPYPDPESCAAGLKGKEYTYFATGHYVFEVVFQRTY